MSGLVAAFLRLLDRNHEMLSLARAGQAPINVKAKRYGLSTESVAGSMDDAELSFAISNVEIASSAAPSRYPRKGDTIGGYVILACDTRRVGETVARHDLTVGGGT